MKIHNLTIYLLNLCVCVKKLCGKYSIVSLQSRVEFNGTTNIKIKYESILPSSKTMKKYPNHRQNNFNPKKSDVRFSNMPRFLGPSAIPSSASQTATGTTARPRIALPSIVLLPSCPTSKLRSMSVWRAVI